MNLDNVVDFDAANEWPLFSVFAECFEEGWVRFVFAGYRSTSRLTNDRKSPFYERLEALPLEPLLQKEAGELIREPFGNLEIEIENTGKLQDHVWSAAKGHPVLIQFYGTKLYRRASSRKPQKGMIEDLDAIEQGFELADFFESHLLRTTIDNGVPCKLERFCAFLYALRGQETSWTQSDFLTQCKAEYDDHVDIDSLQKALRNLTRCQYIVIFCWTIFFYLSGSREHS